jgi:F-type H+-transporting ATPase subunit epsilon
VAGKLTFEVVTPSRKVLSGTCDEVIVPGINGEFGVLPEHAALLSALSPGVLRYREAGKSEALAVRGGFVQVLSDNVIVLADDAALPSELDKAKIQTDRAAIEKKLLEIDVSPEERAKLFDERGWLEAQLAMM